MRKPCQLFNYIKITLLALSASLLLNACSTPIEKDGPPKGRIDVSQIHNPTPRQEPKSRYGNPSSYVIAGKRYYVLPTSDGYKKKGIASWYGTKFHGRLTSSREPYDMLAMTAASPELPIPCYAEVTNLENGERIIVRVNDRGPFAPNRIIDLSYAAATKLGFSQKGVLIVNETERILLEDSRPGTGRLLAENDRIAVPVGLIQNENDRILFEDDDNDTTLTFDEIGTISFDDILRPDRITLADDSGDSFHSLVLHGLGPLEPLLQEMLPQHKVRKT